VYRVQDGGQVLQSYIEGNALLADVSAAE
jgi:hypothetical protein